MLFGRNVNKKKDRSSCRRKAGTPVKNSWFRKILGRRIAVILLLLIQIVVLSLVLTNRSNAVRWISIGFRVIAVYIAVYVIYKAENTSTKTAWVFLLLLFPIVGSVLYMIVHFQASTKHITRNISKLEERSRPLYGMYRDSRESASDSHKEQQTLIRYLQDQMGYPVFDQTETVYYSPGEEFLSDYLDALASAERYIFLEYFIISEGEAWTKILEILKTKAAQGVDVRLIYDDIGCFVKLPHGYAKHLESFGIKCTAFNPFRPILSSIQNNRDHRKITAIDGKVAFTGGLNLSDEYFNIVKKYGHWKDCAIQLKGKAAWSMTLMFLEMWNLCRKSNEDFAVFFPGSCERTAADGFVQPYADSPLDNEAVGEAVYLHLIHHAQNYLYITTPYFVVNDSMITALTHAAKSGVDVRILLPHIYDHPLVHATARSYYRRLTEGGVRVYEYSSGYVHSKNLVSDDRIATVGTINMDYRSLYLHFECGTVLYGGDTIQSLKQDFIETMEKSHMITSDECNPNLFVRLFQELLRLFAPLM